MLAKLKTHKQSGTKVPKWAALTVKVRSYSQDSNPTQLYGLCRDVKFKEKKSEILGLSSWNNTNADSSSNLAHQILKISRLSSHLTTHQLSDLCKL